MALWKIFLISLGFAYDFSFCQNYGWFRIRPPKNTEKPISHKIFFGEYVKISRFHHIPGSYKPQVALWKIFLNSIGFAYDFSFCQNYGPFYEKSQKSASKRRFFGGKLIGLKNGKILEFEKVELWKDNDFLKWFPIFSCIFWSKIVMKRRGQDP